MHIEIDLTEQPPAASLADPDNFRAFHVVVRGVPERSPAEAVAGVRGIGAAGDDVLVPVATVLELAGARAADPTWMEQFDALRDYASQRGWLSADGSRIQAHCETETPS